jgi:lipopolysaccharide transport system ATP-binding protein
MASVITVENLSKRYIIGHQKQQRYTALRDVLADGAKRIGNKLIHPFAKPSDDPTHEEFWALRDVSFDIQEGDRVGIIGRNGAGKSTLLKILSRITEPTSGRVSIRGRVASLLEVGTGFHPELTGRENIFLNGAILGMSKAEIKSKFDEIVAFAEVERFLDTPVKRYSSGMYVRLAFAVAAHLEPEILIVDEVLAVGDAQFQKKCLGKMEEVGKEGRTVLFVSHNMAAIQKLCRRAILLERGSVQFEGPSEIAMSHYLVGGDENSERVFSVDQNKLKACHGKGVDIINIQMLSGSGAYLKNLQTNDPTIIRIDYKTSEKMSSSPIAFIVQVKATTGQEIFRLSTMPISGYEIDHLGRSGYIDLMLDSIPLVGGHYYLDVGVSRPSVEYLYIVNEVANFFVSSKDVYGSGVAIEQNRGLIVLSHKWSHHPDKCQQLK